MMDWQASRPQNSNCGTSLYEEGTMTTRTSITTVAVTATIAAIPATSMFLNELWVDHEL